METRVSKFSRQDEIKKELIGQLETIRTLQEYVHNTIIQLKLDAMKANSAVSFNQLDEIEMALASCYKGKNDWYNTSYLQPILLIWRSMDSYRKPDNLD